METTKRPSQSALAKIGPAIFPCVYVVANAFFGTLHLLPSTFRAVAGGLFLAGITLLLLARIGNIRRRRAGGDPAMNEKEQQMYFGSWIAMGLGFALGMLA